MPLKWSRVDQLLLEGVLWVLPAAVLFAVVLDEARGLRRARGPAG